MGFRTGSAYAAKPQRRHPGHNGRLTAVALCGEQPFSFGRNAPVRNDHTWEGELPRASPANPARDGGSRHTERLELAMGYDSLRTGE